MKFENTLKFARSLDRNDPLRTFRKKFLLPPGDIIYFAGNSLGLQPVITKKFVNEELDDWARLGVEGHLHSRRPWVGYQKFSKKALAELTGAKTNEVVAMNHLTVNLHLLMTSFYRPSAGRFIIIAENGAFSSDQYAFESQVKFHGFDPATAIVELRPRPGEWTLRTKDITEAIRTYGDSVALVIFGGVHYYTGQFFDIKAITQAAHEVGSIAGFDLAHAIGNVPLHLHRNDVDFAVWCSYKYLNSGPGSVAGAFVHERFARDFSRPRLAGWWGHNEHERFKMEKGFKPMEGVDGWQVSNHPVLTGAAHLAALEVFHEAGMVKLRRKSEELTAFLQFVLLQTDKARDIFEIITPSARSQRGCQLSLYMKKKGKEVFRSLTENGIVADWREPNVIRVAPVPLYNTFEEVYRFGQIFRKALS